MAYTLTQARTLLSTPELALFDASRAQPIKALTAAQLRAKVTRARALRDKFRDLYRRQTVGTRAAPAAKRSAVGGDNERTQRKADLFAEVLTRFEERLQRVEADAQAAAAKPARAAKPIALKAAVAKALKRKTVAVGKATPQADRSAKAPATQRAPRKPATSAASTKQPAVARSSPLRQRADNLATHAHAKSQGRRVQGKRDGTQA